ncbi:hypothetical protein LUZ60_016964 [Juncus effusus]|nr:hypothetical protein LUZ60_016964 [Juncus effusus]
MVLLFLLMHFSFSSSQPSSQPDPSIFDVNATKASCGTAPFPFGPPGTALPGFEVRCINDSDRTAFLAIQTKSGVYQIKNFSLQGQVKIMNGPIYKKCYYGNNRSNKSGKRLQGWLDLEETPYTVSEDYSNLIAVGCDDVLMIEAMNFRSGCVVFCNNLTDIRGGPCSGLGCCQAPLPVGLKSFDLQLNSISNIAVGDQLEHVLSQNQSGDCSTIYFATREQFSSKTVFSGNKHYIDKENYVVVLDWAIGNTTCQKALNEPNYACKQNSQCHNSPTGVGYLCKCRHGYQGNPYAPDGCTDIDECRESNPCVGRCINTQGNVTCRCPKGMLGDGKKDGSGCKKKPFPIVTTLSACLALLFLLFMTSFCCYWRLQERKLIKIKSKYFVQNGGWILRQRLASYGIDSTSRIFTMEELQRATDNYNESRILGRGGYGTVYKGFLSDHRVVAIKRSKLVDNSQVEQFINEITILSQVNHRNVVKLLGCCLETEVPLLVYEFISNGTLFEHIHCRGPLPWEDRLRISTETARAIAYLHFAASFPIIHRDIKSSNILLDEKFTAKVSDFGASRSVPFDQTHVTTLVQGTLGYLDPEYFYTSQLTEKSDVYSFGVVLAELLTGKKPISSDRSDDSCNLAIHFTTSIDTGQFVQLLEPHVLEDARLDEVHLVANLAKRCLNVKGEERPNMKEVASELEGLRRANECASRRSRRRCRDAGGSGTSFGTSPRWSSSASCGRRAAGAGAWFRSPWLEREERR